MTRAAGKSEDAQAQVLNIALRLMRPYARLLIAQGLKYGEAAEVLKRAFVEASRDEIARADGAANASRISVATGLHRQDIKRLLETPADDIERGRSIAAEVYTRWVTNARYRSKGKPRELPMRAGEGKVSFEALSRSISTDVHPRTVSEELRRLGLVVSDDDGATLRVSPEGFVPLAERAGMLGFLGENVGDHLSVAVANVLGDTPRRLEQAVYAEGLDERGVGEVDERARAIWREAMEQLVPLLEALVAARGDGPRQRVRIGMYMQAMPQADEPAARPGNKKQKEA